MGRIWYGQQGNPYTEDAPDFFDKTKFSWVKEIEDNGEKIKPELQKFIAEKDKSFIANNYDGIDGAKGWSSFTFIFWGLNLSSELDKNCPVLTSFLNKIPGLSSSSLSQLAPTSEIPRHRGDTNAIIRCHFGIEVPAALPYCGLKAGETEQGWEEGKWLLFNDAKIHSAWNRTCKRRIVLIIDVLRPEFLHKKNIVCARILTYQLINNKLKWNSFLKNNPFFKRLLVTLILPGIYVYRLGHNLVTKRNST